MDTEETIAVIRQVLQSTDTPDLPIDVKTDHIGFNGELVTAMVVGGSHLIYPHGGNDDWAVDGLVDAPDYSVGLMRHGLTLTEAVAFVLDDRRTFVLDAFMPDDRCGVD